MLTYANLSERSIATLIDFTIVFTALMIVEAFLFTFNFTNSEYNNYRIFIATSVWILYNSLFDSSIYQGTIGKIILKIKVINLYGKRMSVIMSFCRCLSTIISVLPFGLGLWYVTTDPKRRAWHDLIVGSYVIK